jgi:hypothetical protein
MSQQVNQEFSGLRKLVWPIHSHEVKKFLPMGIMMFCILFIYTVLRLGFCERDRCYNIGCLVYGSLYKGCKLI